MQMLVQRGNEISLTGGHETRAPSRPFVVRSPTNLPTAEMAQSGAPTSEYQSMKISWLVGGDLSSLVAWAVAHLLHRT